MDYKLYLSGYFNLLAEDNQRSESQYDSVHLMLLGEGVDDALLGFFTYQPLDYCVSLIVLQLLFKKTTDDLRIKCEAQAEQLQIYWHQVLFEYFASDVGSYYF